MIQCRQYFSLQALRLLAALTLGLGVQTGFAQAPSNYPTRQLTMVVPNATGGTNDIVGRIIALELAEEFKQLYWSTGQGLGATLVQHKQKRLRLTAIRY